MKLTVKIKLITDQKQYQLLLETMEHFNDACNYASNVAYETGKYGAVHLHHQCYHQLRKQFGLPSQLSVRAVGKVTDSYATSKCIKTKKINFERRGAVVYDDRLLTFKSLDKVSICTLNGRILVPFQVGEYAKLGQRRICGQADLIYTDGVFYLCVVVEQPDGTPIKTHGWLGVDMGIVNIASTSDGKQWTGETIDKKRIKVIRHRARLQSCGSKRSKQRLQKIAKKQSRFVRNINHCISKQIVNTAKALSLGIAIEDLKKIKKTVHKAERQRFGQWSFFQLGAFLEYKSRLAGIPFVKVNPAYTSCACNVCGHCEKSNRKSQSEFVCKHCGFSMDADLNAAINIAARAVVNQPIVVNEGNVPV